MLYANITLRYTFLLRILTIHTYYTTTTIYKIVRLSPVWFCNPPLSS